MGTDKQKETPKENIKKAQRRWQEMTPQERALVQPEGRKRAKPGTKGEGDYFRNLFWLKAHPSQGNNQ